MLGRCGPVPVARRSRRRSPCGAPTAPDVGPPRFPGGRPPPGRGDSPGRVVAGRVESADVAEIVSYLGDGTPNPGSSRWHRSDPRTVVPGRRWVHPVRHGLGAGARRRRPDRGRTRVRAVRQPGAGMPLLGRAVHLTRLLPDGAVDPDFTAAPAADQGELDPVFDLRSKLVTWADGSIGRWPPGRTRRGDQGPPGRQRIGPGLRRRRRAFVQPGAEAGCGVGDDVGVLDLRPDGTLLATFEHGPTGSPAPGPDCDWVAVQLTADGVLDPTLRRGRTAGAPQWYLDPYTRSSSDGDGGFSVIVPGAAPTPASATPVKVSACWCAATRRTATSAPITSCRRTSSCRPTPSSARDAPAARLGRRRIGQPLRPLRGGDSPYRRLIALG